MSTTRLLLTFTMTLFVAGVHAEISYKRIPSGFLGMRGKKSLDYFEDGMLQPDFTDSVALNKMLDSLQADYHPYPESSMFDRHREDMLYYPDHFESSKRAPLGFQGVRGKKDYSLDTGPGYDDLFAYDFYDKRAPMGFQGMRGKREYEYPLLNYMDEKRAPLGFQGMRGKKSEDEFDNQKLDDDKKEVIKSPEQEKSLETVPSDHVGNDLETGDVFISTKQRRATNVGFMGVRGKKMPSVASFFGMRGKKGPYEYLPFRGKFVGVRGKKLFEERPGDMRLLTNPWNSDSYLKRKGPSGFLGMRGKKWVRPEAGNVHGDNANIENTED